MPVELLMTNHAGALVPAYPQDEEEMLRVPERQLVQVRISRTAPSKLKAWYRALLGRLFDACPGAWPDPQMTHRSLLLRCGFFESCIVTDFGDMKFSPPSTRDWDDIQWRTYINALWPIIVNEIIPEIGEKRLSEGIKVMIGLDLTQALEE